MKKEERQRRQKAARATQHYALSNRVTAVRFSEYNLGGLNEYAKHAGLSRNALINAMITHCLSGQVALNLE